MPLGNYLTQKQFEAGVSASIYNVQNADKQVEES